MCLSYAEPILPLTHKQLRAKIWSHVSQQWHKRWNEMTEARQSKLWLSSREQKHEYLYKLKIEEVSQLIRIYTGHIMTRYHAYNIGKYSTPTCMCNLSNQTIAHLVAECPIFVNERILYLNSPRVQFNTLMDTPFKPLLSFYMAVKDRVEVLHQDA